ncbi:MULTISPECIES: hypothetical protein [Burkholderia]|uniref:hypothetical protein n=1 Tax=Burkholderia TaxID=32008 RepID=UPI0018C35E48|nr:MULTISPECIES: hypothetical protein [Burkholderia]MBG0863720.1 hypothetical protein [Burkholderia sp. 9779_493]MCV9913932.1 hypothetical protein [Burkholderia pseudomallei]MCW0071264.1 hypothetical protein [Burkholderia pseudomallei]
MSDLLISLLACVSNYDKEDLQKMIDRRQDIDSLVIEFARQNNFTNYDLLNFTFEESKQVKKLLDIKFNHYFNHDFPFHSV